MNSCPRQQRPAVVLSGHCSALLVLSPAQAILLSPFSSTFTVPSFDYKQFHIICTHKLFLQLFRLEHNKTHKNFVWPFYEKWQHQRESVVFKKRKKRQHSQPSAKTFSCLTIFIIGENGGGVTQIQDVKAQGSCDLVPNLNPNQGGREGQDRIMIYQRT